MSPHEAPLVAPAGVISWFWLNRQSEPTLDGADSVPHLGTERSIFGSGHHSPGVNTNSSLMPSGSRKKTE